MMHFRVLSSVFHLSSFAASLSTRSQLSSRTTTWLTSTTTTPPTLSLRMASTSSSEEKTTPQQKEESTEEQPREDDEYVLPRVWENTESGGKWSSINRPTAGARHEKELPRGKHPLQLYSMGTPNGQKVTILLEELLEAGHGGAEYDAWLIGIGDGDQFGSGFVDLNPNSKIPALLDTTTNTRMFESGSILLQLSEKFGNAFMPAEHRSEVLNWLFWQMGSGPYVGGGFGHFFAYAPHKMRYPIDRFTMETKRQLDVLEKQLSDGRPCIVGDEYTLADIAIWPWYGRLVLGQLYGDGAAVFLNAGEDYPSLVGWAKELAKRPGVDRGGRVNKPWGKEGENLAERHDSSDFDSLSM